MPRPRREAPRLDTDAQTGVYTVVWYDPADQRTKRRSLGTRDAGQAAARFAAFVQEARSLYAPSAEDLKRLAAETAGPLTVGQALDLYEREHVDTKVVDKDRARDVLANLRAFFGQMPVRDVSFAQSRAYVLARELGDVGGKGRRGAEPMPGSPATCRRELTVLVAAVNHCLKHGHLPSDGLRRDMRGRVVLVDLPPDSKPVQRWLTRDEMARLRAECGETGRLRWFLEIAYYTASRRDAVETLTWFQVDLERGRINLAKPGETITTKRRPVVPIDPQLRPWLDEAQAGREAAKALIAAARAQHADMPAGAKRDEALARISQAEAGLVYVLGSAVSVYRPFKKACARAGLGDDVIPHVLRHTRATHLLQDGVSLFAVANLLGDTTSTVERVYGSHSASFMAEVLGGKGTRNG